MSTFSIVRQPSFLEPVYQNTIAFVVDSTNATASNFKYVFDVYTNDIFSGTYSFRTRVSTYPRTDATCVFSPHYVLKDQLSYNFTPYTTTYTQATQSLGYYYIRLGESYNPGLQFVDTFNFLGLLSLTFSVAPDLNIGDIIRIDKDDKSINPEYDGTASVSGKSLAGTLIITDKPFGITSSNEGGNIIEVTKLVATSSRLSTFNGTRQYDEILTNFRSTYELNDTFFNRKFLTSFVGEKPIYYKDGEYATYETLSFLLGTQSNTTWNSLGFKIQTFDKDNTPLLTLTQSMNTAFKTGTPRYDGAVGTANLVGFNVGGNPLMNNNVDKYNVTLFENVGGLTFSETRTYKIKRQCREYELITLAFLNKLGGIDYWTFNLLSKYQSRINRTTIQKVLQYNYKIGDRGRQVIDQEIREEWTINTDYLNDDEALFIKELVESPEVYYLDGINMLPIIITSDTYDFKSTLNNILIQYTINFVKAYDTISNV
jgi:hypothetical protein